MNYVIGGGTSEILSGTKEDDYIYADNGNDILDGGAGNDILSGASHIPGMLAGTLDLDELYGGEGSDKFVLGTVANPLYRGMGLAIVRDFNASEGDLLIVNDAIMAELTFESANQLGSSTPDVRVYDRGDLIAIVQDVKTPNNLVFLPASSSVA